MSSNPPSPRYDHSGWAIDVRGDERGGDGTTQVVFDLESGQFERSSSEQPVATDGSHERERALDSEIESVLEELRALDVNETPRSN